MGEQEDLLRFDPIAFNRARMEGRAMGHWNAAVAEAKLERFRRNPQLALADLPGSIGKMSELFGVAYTSLPPNAAFLALEESELFREMHRFDFLTEVVTGAGITDLPKGFNEARELVQATRQIFEALDDEEEVIFFSPQSRQIPAGRALQAVLAEDSETSSE